MEHKDTDDFDIDFANKHSGSEDDSEIQFMNFTLSKSAQQEEDAQADDFFAKIDQISIFDLAQENSAQEESIEPEEVAVEPVSDLEEIAEEVPETLSEISEEPLPDPDDIEINIVNWNGSRKSSAAPLKSAVPEEPAACKPIFVDDTKDADEPESCVSVPEMQEPHYVEEQPDDDDDDDDEIEIKFRHYRKSTQQRAERSVERQKKNGGA